MFLIIIIIAVLFFVVYNHNKQKQRQSAINAQRAEEEQARRHKQYLLSLAPSYFGHIQITMPRNDQEKLGGNGNINYMFSYKGLYGENIVTFPESRYGNNIRYYLLHIRFQPKYVKVSQGYTLQDSDDYTYGDDFDGYHTVRSPESYEGLSRNQEQPTSALLTLTPINFSRTIIITLNNVFKSDVDFMIKNAVLGNIEKHKILKAKRYVQSIAPKCNSYYYYHFSPSFAKYIANILSSNKPIYFMFLNNDDDTITFPESNEGNMQLYYLIKLYTIKKATDNYFILMYFTRVDNAKSEFRICGHGMDRYMISILRNFVVNDEILNNEFSSEQLQIIQKLYEQYQIRFINNIKKREPQIFNY